MTEEELSYINNLSAQIPGFQHYFIENAEKGDLITLLNEYSQVLRCKGMLTQSVQFIISAVQRIYFRSQENSFFIMTQCNHHKRFDDTEIIREFTDEANDSFWGHDLEEEHIEEFLHKYLETYNPYVCYKIADPFIKTNRYEVGFTFIQQAANYTFSSPNIYWDNEEAIYGCAQTAFTLVNLLQKEGLTMIEKMQSKLSTSLLEYTFLLLSRIIYWNDTNKPQRFAGYDLPISSREKIAAHSRRAELLRTFREFFVGEHMIETNFDAIIIYDYTMAHHYACQNSEVGQHSIYLKEANKTYRCYGRSGSQDDLVNEGNDIGRNISVSLYKNYKLGKYALSRNDIAGLMFYIKSRVENIDEIKIFTNLVSNAEKIYEDKEDKSSIITWLSDNGITEFYHFTRLENLKSIVEHGGLFSYRQCLDKGIIVRKTDDMAELRDKDASFELDDYVRLSFCESHPLIQTRKLKGANLVRLKIKVDVAWFEGTLFSDRDAVDPEHQCGPTIKDLQKVNLRAVWRCDIPRNDPEYSQNQAEVMVRSCVPIKYIININNPEIL